VVSYPIRKVIKGRCYLSNAPRIISAILLIISSSSGSPLCCCQTACSSVKLKSPTYWPLLPCDPFRRKVADNANLKLKGDFKKIFSCRLPNEIAFLHIDCEFGGDKFAHRDVLLQCFESVCPRMANNAVCVLIGLLRFGRKPGGLRCKLGF
jgi:hypothetical protein